MGTEVRNAAAEISKRIEEIRESIQDFERLARVIQDEASQYVIHKEARSSEFPFTRGLDTIEADLEHARDRYREALSYVQGASTQAGRLLK